MPEVFGQVGLLATARVGPILPRNTEILERRIPGRAHVVCFQLTLVVVGREVALCWEVLSAARWRATIWDLYCQDYLIQHGYHREVSASTSSPREPELPFPTALARTGDHVEKWRVVNTYCEDPVFVLETRSVFGVGSVCGPGIFLSISKGVLIVPKIAYFDTL